MDILVTDAADQELSSSLQGFPIRQRAPEVYPGLLDRTIIAAHMAGQVIRRTFSRLD